MIKNISLGNKGEVAIARKEKEQNNKYYAEVSLAIKHDSKLSLSEIQDMFNQNGITATIQLKSGNGREIEPEVLEIWSVDWVDWDSL